MGLWYVLLLAPVLMASIEAAHSATWLPIAIKALNTTNENVKAAEILFCHVSCRERIKGSRTKHEDKYSYLHCEACAELVAYMPVGTTRGQELLLDLAEGCVELSSVLHMRT